MNKAQLHIV